MFSSADGPVGHLQWTAQYLDWSRSHYSESLQPLIVLLTIWICWRLWKFTLVPRIYPNDPKELPYCFPRESSIRNSNVTMKNGIWLTKFIPQFSVRLSTTHLHCYKLRFGLANQGVSLLGHGIAFFKHSPALLQRA